MNKFCYFILLSTVLIACAKKSQPSQPKSENDSETDILSSDNPPLIIFDSKTIETKEELEAIDHSSVETIQVVKDSATAVHMYGQRAKYGVIIIRTKEYELKIKRQEKLQEHLNKAMGHEDEYLFVLDGIVVPDDNIDQLFDLKPEEIAALEELSVEAAAVIYDTTPRNFTIIINTSKRNN